MSWMAMMQSVAISSRQASISSFFGKRVAHLNRGSLFGRRFGEFGRRHGSAVNAVASRLSANVNDRVADTGGFAEEDLVVLEDAEGKHVDQWIAVVTRREDRLATDRRHTEAVAVMRDAADHAFEDALVALAALRIVECPEA